MYPFQILKLQVSLLLIENIGFIEKLMNQNEKNMTHTGNSCAISKKKIHV